MKRSAPTNARPRSKAAKTEAPRHPDHYFSHNPGGLDESATRLLALHVGEHSLEFTTGDGVFSKSALDAGSALLIETFLEQARALEGGRILDLGCGWGPVGCFLAAHRTDSAIGMCDINMRAVELARLNATQNKLTNTGAWCGDGASAGKSAGFDFILCNPPVRAGNTVIARMFEESFRCAKAGGELWVVLRTAQGAKSWQVKLRNQWGNCETLAIDDGYRILRSIKIN